MDVKEIKKDEPKFADKTKYQSAIGVDISTAASQLAIFVRN
jgi:hypothetical protein